MKLSVVFEVEHQTHDLDTFQYEGHFVPAMQDEEQRRRDWEGDTVHVLELRHKGEQVLRVLADSLPEAERVMRRNISDTLFGLWMAQKQTEFSYDQMKRLVDRAGRLQELIDSYPNLKTGPHHEDVFAAASYWIERIGKR
jgi:hypothetical protein